MAANDLAQLRRWTQQRDADAFEDLMRQYAGLVYGAARRILRNDAEAEEIAQECFLKLAQADNGVSTNVPGWLHRTATNLSLNRFKENKRRGARETAYAAAGSSTAEPTWDEIEPLVDAAVDDLPESVRAIVVRHYLDGKPYHEVAAEFGLTQAQAVYRIQKGVERIRKSLARKGVKTSASGLAALLAARLCTPASAAVLAKLGKIALAGSAGAITPAAAAVSWTFLQPAIFVALAIVVAATAFVATRGTREPDESAVPDVPASGLESFGLGANEQSIALAAAPAPINAAGLSNTMVLSQNTFARGPGTSGPGEIRGTAHLDTTGRSYYNPPFADDGYVMASLISWMPDEIPPEDPIVLIARPGVDNFFRFEDLPLGVWAVRVVSEGRTALNFVALTRDEPRKFVSVGLAYTIAPTTGRVVDEDGRPIAGASVGLVGFVDAQSDVTNEWPVLAEMHTVTGSDGGFMLQFTGTGDRAPESYRVTVRKEGFAPYASDVFEGGRSDLEFVLVPGVPISGTLIDTDGKPIAKAELQIASDVKWDRRAFTTDQDGGFRLEHLGPYEYAIQTTAGALIVSAETRHVDLQDGVPPENLILEAVSGGTVEGRLVNTRTGAGIPNVDIDLYEPGKTMRDQYYIGYGVRYGDRSTLTDAEGRYRFEGLPEGAYTLEHGDIPGLPKYHAKIAKNRFQRVEGIPGKTALLADTAIPYGKSISGRVVNHNGLPLSDVVILAAPSGRMPAGVMYSPQDELYAMTDARGRFQIAGLDENTNFGLLAELDKPFYIPEGYVAELVGPFEGPDDVRDVEIVMQPESKISATVIDETGQPMFRARVHAIAPGLPSANLQNVSVGGRAVSSDGPVTVKRDVHWRTTGPDGHVTIDKLGAAEYDLYIDGGISGGPQVGPVKRVKVGVGEHLEGLQLTYTTPQGLVLTGRVTDTSGRPITDATVQLSGPAQFSATTKSDGSYRMVGIAPGRYLVYASHPQYSTRSQENFDPATATWTVQLVGRGSVTGQVFYRGAPVPRFTATSFDGDLTAAIENQQVYLPNAGSRPNGADGVFTLRSIGAGDVTVVVQAPGCAPAYKVVRGLREGEVRQVEPFQLVDESVLLGTLLGADGTPVARATVVLAARPNSEIRTDTEGAFKIDGLPAGNHAITVSAENLRPQQLPFSIRAGQTLEQTFRLRETRRVLVRIELDGAPVADGGAAIVTLGPSSELQNIDSGNPSGEPGMYIVDDTQMSGTMVLGFAQTATGPHMIRALVNLAETGEQLVVLRMTSGTAALQGTVTDADGGPVSSPVTVWWDTENGREFVPAQSDANGDYTFQNLPAGRVNITVSENGLSQLLADAVESVPVTLRAGQSVQYDLVNTKVSANALNP